jgi:ankyrin repeat protein
MLLAAGSGVRAEDADIPGLIDKLVEAEDGDDGYDPYLKVDAFAPLYSVGAGRRPVLFQKLNRQSDTLRLLVKHGAAALPHLAAHLGDERKTAIKFDNTFPVASLFFRDDPDRNDRTDKSPGPVKKGAVQPEGNPFSHTVTVGDLCFVAIGQIVNRQFSVFRNMPTAIFFIDSPTRSPVLRERVQRAWGSLKPEQHRASLAADFLKPDTDERRIGACIRLACYYPDTLETLALKILARPTNAAGPPVGGLSSSDKALLIEEGLIYDHSEKLDRAVRDLLATSGEDAKLARACIKRLAGRGYDGDIEAYRRRWAEVVSEEEDRDILDRLGWSPLHAAVDRHDRDAVARLLRDKATPDAAARNGKTPLHLAAGAGNLEVAKMLVEAGAAIDAKDKAGLTPVQLAMREECLDIVRFLTGRRCSLPDVLVAAAAGQSDRVEEILRADPGSIKAKTRFQALTPLHLAAWSGKTGVAGVLVARGLPVDSRDEREPTALHLAAAFGSDAVVRELIRLKADVRATFDKEGPEPLHLAAERGHVKATEVLLDAKAALEAKRRGVP